MKTLRQSGVPFGARVLFRLQWLPLIVSVLVLIVSLPILGVWALIHDSGLEFIRGAQEVLEAKKAAVLEHRDKLIKMYAGGAAKEGE